LIWYLCVRANVWIETFTLHLHLSHLADALIQSDLQIGTTLSLQYPTVVKAEVLSIEVDVTALAILYCSHLTVMLVPLLVPSQCMSTVSPELACRIFSPFWALQTKKSVLSWYETLPSFQHSQLYRPESDWGYRSGEINSSDSNSVPVDP
jgi:hypothetical protein